MSKVLEFTKYSTCIKIVTINLVLNLLCLKYEKLIIVFILCHCYDTYLNI